MEASEPCRYYFIFSFIGNQLVNFFPIRNFTFFMTQHNDLKLMKVINNYYATDHLVFIFEFFLNRFHSIHKYHKFPVYLVTL